MGDLWHTIRMLGGIEGAVENSFCAVRFLQTLFEIG